MFVFLPNYVDLDECLSVSTNNCSDVTGHEVCINGIGSYVCTCDSLGFHWNATACEGMLYYVIGIDLKVQLVVFVHMIIVSCYSINI